jgi:hypothetical protein
MQAAKKYQVPEDAILHSDRRGNLKAYLVFLLLFLLNSDIRVRDVGRVFLFVCVIIEE